MTKTTIYFQDNFYDTTDITTEPSDLLTTNSDIINDIGPFVNAGSSKNDSIIFEVIIIK